MNKVAIQVTQFLRPDGRRRAVETMVDADVGMRAHALIADCFHFEIEELPSGQVSMTCDSDFPDEHGDHVTLGHEIAANAPGEPEEAFKRLVDNSILALNERYRESEVPGYDHHR